MWEESWLSLGLLMTHFVIKGLPVWAVFPSAWEAVCKSRVDGNLVFSETTPAVWPSGAVISLEKPTLGAMAQGQNDCLAHAGSWVQSLAPTSSKSM